MIYTLETLPEGFRQVYQGGHHNAYCDGVRHLKTSGGYAWPDEWPKRARDGGECDCFMWRAEPPRECAWTGDGEYAAWDTACGHRFVIYDGTPEQNGMRFCCYCGGRLAMSEAALLWKKVRLAAEEFARRQGLDTPRQG